MECAATLIAVTLHRASLATVLALLLAAGGAAFWVSARRPHLGPLHAAPDARRLSIEVGEAVHFSAAAPGAVEFTWSMWGSTVSHLPTWTYVALPEDAGWQQVTVVVRGATGSTLMHAWDVGVVPPVPPALEVSPPPGRVVVRRGGRATFHCGARVPAARPADRVWFEWIVDGRTMSRQEQSAAEAVSEFLLPAPESGPHRVTVRVVENERSASLAEWELVGAGPAPQPELPVQIADARPIGRPEPTPPPQEAAPPPVAEPEVPPPHEQLAEPERPAPESVAREVEPEMPRAPDAPAHVAEIEMPAAPEGPAQVAEPEAQHAPELPPPVAEQPVPPSPPASVPPAEPSPDVAAAPSAPAPEEPAIPKPPPDVVPAAPEPPTQIAAARMPAVSEPAPPVVVARPTPEPAPPVAEPQPTPRDAAVPAPRPLPPRSPVPSRIAGDVGERLHLATGIGSGAANGMYEWSVDGRRVQRGASPSFEYTPDTPGRHRVSVVLHGPTAVAAADAWEVTARERRPPRVEPSTARQEERVPPAEPPRVATVPRATLPPPVPPTTAARIDEHAAPPMDASRVTRSATALSEEEVQHWFAEYAHAWSSHDVGALQRMGQVRSQADAERLTRYFGTIENLRVDVRIRAVRLDGERAAVDFERVDTMTDPTGRRQELRLPLQHKDIERTPAGLRFVN